MGGNCAFPFLEISYLIIPFSLKWGQQNPEHQLYWIFWYSRNQGCFQTSTQYCESLKVQAVLITSLLLWWLFDSTHWKTSCTNVVWMTILLLYYTCKIMLHVVLYTSSFLIFMYAYAHIYICKNIFSYLCKNIPVRGHRYGCEVIYNT